MAKIGLFEKTPERWFDFDNDTEVLLKHVSKEALAALMEKAEKVSKKTGIKPAVAYDVFLGRAAVLNWRKKDDHDHPGFLLPDGALFNFTPENRDRLMRLYREFSSFVFTNSTLATGFLENDAIEPVTDDDLFGLEDLIADDETEPKN
ncbi:MAG: hypothetical protein VB050_04240 [Geobacteraceae bacterium]|nr:hypothetical protein [Geobacteraceae bacterium]